MIYMNYPARIPEGRQNEQSADLLTVSVFRDLPEEFDEAATVRGAENLLRRNRHRACKRRLSQAYSLPRQIITPAVAAPLADQSGQRGHCQQFHVVAQMALCGGTGNLLPQFSNKNWMGFAKSLTVASGEIPFSSQERSFLLQNLQWRSHSPFRNRTRRDGKNSTSVFPSRPQQSPGAVRSPAEAPAFPTAHCG